MYRHGTYDYQQSYIENSKCANMDMEPYNIQPILTLNCIDICTVTGYLRNEVIESP